MKWKRVKGPGDMVRGVSMPDTWSAVRQVQPKSDLGYQMDNYVNEAKRQWGARAAERQWAGQARLRAQRDANIGGVERSKARMGPLKPLPTITHRKPKPKSIMNNIWLGQATHIPAKRRG